MDESYCAFCGVCFGIFPGLYQDRLEDEDVAWTEYFRALRKRSYTINSHSITNWFLSGVGKGITREGRAPPTIYDARYLNEDEDDLDTGDRVVAYKGCATGDEVVFPVHPICWDLFLQNHALLAGPTACNPDLNLLGEILSSQDLEQDGRGLHPSWTKDYGGPEQFWADGWRHHEGPEASEVAGILDWSTEWDFLVRDPGTIESFDNLTQNPPLAPTSKVSLPIKVKPRNKSTCPFARLPQELLLSILTLLSTPSVGAVRVATPSMAIVELSMTFWRSRFEFPHELSHISPPSTLSVGQEEWVNIDWIELRRRILGAPNDSNDCLRNRRRILRLTRLLVQELLDEAEVGSKAKQTLSIQPNLKNFQSIARPGFKVQSRASTTLKGDLSPGDLKRISVTFKSSCGHRLLTGVAFTGVDGIFFLGDCNVNTTSFIDLSPDVDILSITVAVSTEGIMGIKFSLRVCGDEIDFQEPDFGTLSPQTAYGRLCPVDDTPVAGVDVGLDQHGRLISIGILESEEACRSTQFRSTSPLPAFQNALWRPSIPPLTLRATPVTYNQEYGTTLSYLQYTVFAEQPRAAEHLVRVSAFLDLSPVGVQGFQFHFDDREAIPPPFSFRGKEIPFLIDGPDGERLIGSDVVRSKKSGHAGLLLLTNRGRRAYFATADVSGDIEIERVLAIPGTSFVGIFGQLIVEDDHTGAYQSFGVLCSKPDHIVPPATPLAGPEDNRRFDDHWNVWTGGVLPSTYPLGEAIGSQPTHGYINWIDFRLPIKQITACVVRTRNLRGEVSSPVLSGLRFDFYHGESNLLGRCSDFGQSFHLEEDDKIQAVVIGQADNLHKTINSIQFITVKGLDKSFSSEGIIKKPDKDETLTHVASSGLLELIGFAWSFDLGPAYSGDNGIQPIYFHKTESAQTGPLRSLYPSIEWVQPPTSHIRLRPIPSIKASRYPLTSSQLSCDEEMIYCDTNITLITVYYNAFLQGLQFSYRNGQQRSMGNLIGAEKSFELDQERIFAVETEQRVQMLSSMSLPRETVCVNRIRFGLVKWINGHPEARFTAFAGATMHFGPFRHRQRGLWHADGGGSAWPDCFQTECTRIYLEPRTSFAGLYAEANTTHIHRLGVLVTTSNPLPKDVATLSEAPPSSAPSSPDTSNKEEAVLWLSYPPPTSLTLSTTAGYTHGTYRTWCLSPRPITRVTIYRHPLGHGPVVVGLEFFGRSRGESSLSQDFKQGDQIPSSTLLGFRTLWMEAALSAEIGEGERIMGFRVKERKEGDYPSGDLGIEDIQIITSSPSTEPDDTRTDTEGWKTVTVSADKELVGFHAFVDSFIEGIGILEK